ncbi:hypothetical protein IEQ34_013851 [Dendrobium chrysotoxum]|uniref:C2H2-type domain-containing protein n=1 Tax=Dendrobium chrysotoxum TaxID=161865 RepID=A0AAV7GPM4_DENCH|nr:hypothetical protein IEQ34_013851 [Dendrobium chrysotoxum]
MHSAKAHTSYLMCSRRNSLCRPLLPSFNYFPSTDVSWEEQAFAKDSSGDLGGCVWPPRSYTCSFCRREFRSAQALGGHMNVHRRDRARLKEASSHRGETDEDVQLYYPFSSYICSPNPNSDALGVEVASFLLPKEEIYSQQSIVSVSLEIGRENWKTGELDHRRIRDFFYGDGDISSKKVKTDLILTSDRKDCPDNLQNFKSEVIKLSHNPVEELDLELRLGDSPKVKE